MNPIYQNVQKQSDGDKSIKSISESKLKKKKKKNPKNQSDRKLQEI